MQSQTSQTPIRRRHGVTFKTAVLAACREPGASVAAVAQAHGLNANLVRKWLVGRGVKRCGVELARTAGAPIPPAVAAITDGAAAMQFVPVQVPAPAPPLKTAESDEAIQIELTRAGAMLTVRWPAAQASSCASWLGELAQVLSR
jgi:transposase